MNSVELLSEGEIQQLAQRITDNRDRLLLQVLYETGCRVHEVVSIRIKDVNIGDACIVVGGRRIPLSTSTVALVKSYADEKERGQYLFSSRQSVRMTKKRVRQIIQGNARKVLGKKVSPQTLRYSHIAHALASGMSIERVRVRVGLERLRARQIAKALEVHLR